MRTRRCGLRAHAWALPRPTWTWPGAAPRHASRCKHAQRAGRDVDRSSSRDASVGLVLEVPLFAGSLRKQRESVAQAQIDAARAELRGAERQVAQQAWAAYQAAQTHAAALRHAQAHEADAQALLAAQLASYRIDHSDLTDVLEAHATHLSAAKLTRLASLNAWRQARMRLAAALGRLHVSHRPRGAGRWAPLTDCTFNRNFTFLPLC